MLDICMLCLTAFCAKSAVWSLAVAVNVVFYLLSKYNDVFWVVTTLTKLLFPFSPH